MKNPYKLVSFLIVSAVLFSFKPVYQANFSGTWSLNEGKSELGQFGARAAASRITVDQKEDAITITRATADLQGNPTALTETLGYDGKESESTGFANSKKKSSLKWSADGNSFIVSYTIAFDRGGQVTELKGSETWSLGADGKSLLLQNSLSTPQGDFATKAAYDKQ